MKNKIIFIFAFFVLATMMNAQTVEEVLDMHYKAVGGKERFEAIKSWHLVGKSKLGVNEPGDFQFIFVRPNQMKVKTVIDTFKIIQAVNRDKGWQVIPTSGVKEPVELQANEVDKILGQKALVLGPFFEYKEKGATITYDGVVKKNGGVYKKLTIVTRDNGPKSTVFLNDTTNLIHVIETETLSNGNPISIANVLSNYQDIDGFMFPFSFVSNINGKQYTQLELDNILLDRKYSDNVFDMPKTKSDEDNGDYKAESNEK